MPKLDFFESRMIQTSSGTPSARRRRTDGNYVAEGKKKGRASGLKKETPTSSESNRQDPSDPRRTNAHSAGGFLNWLKAVRLLALLKHVCQQEPNCHRKQVPGNDKNKSAHDRKHAWVTCWMPSRTCVHSEKGQTGCGRSLCSRAEPRLPTYIQRPGQ